MKIHLREASSIENSDGLIVCTGNDLDVSKAYGLPIEHLKQKETFEGKIGEVQFMTLVQQEKLQDVALIGVGNSEKFCETKFIKSLGEAIKGLKKKKVSHIVLDLKALSSVAVVDKKLQKLIFSALIMCDYEFNDYKTDAKPSTLETISVLGNDLDESCLNEGVILGETNVFSRYLTNMPANIMTPDQLAKIAKDYVQPYGLEIEIKDENQIEALGMHAYLAVAKASANPPRLIVMRHMGAPESDKRLALVGKGLTYDSGGLSIKPTASMVTMKDDMGGASAVIAAMGAIARLDIKANVIGIVAACENMISGLSYKPGDIISSMGGKSIYIGNTDAEGRLTLIDAVTYGLNEEKATHVVDIATLTGAAIHCLGSVASPVVTNNDDFYHMVEKSFNKADEKVWKMPVFDAYKELVKHDQADLTNTAGAPGTITAGIFIGEFAKDVPWVHIDIAGTAFKDKASGIYSKGGTGSGAIPLVYLAKKMTK